MEEKKYGLIRLSKPSKPLNTLSKNIFESDSEDDSQNPSEAVKRVDTSSGIRRQTQLDISRALTDDPNVFEYDSIYDQMKGQFDSVEPKESEKKEKTAKYINNLMKFSENRKKETERRTERKIQKERESEGNEFEDKEQFVTNAYKQKLEEMRAQDETDRRQQLVDDILDVKKQKDLSGFYRHLLNNDLTSQTTQSKPESVEIPKDIPIDTPMSPPKQLPTIIAKPKTKRQFRQRRSSSEDSSVGSPQTDVTNETNVGNLLQSSERVDKNLNLSKETEERVESSGSESEDNGSSAENSKRDSNRKSKQTKQQNKSNLTIDSITEKNSSANEETNERQKLDKRDILLKKFTKRTVDQVYSAAQLRYFDRKHNYVI